MNMMMRRMTQSYFAQNRSVFQMNMIKRMLFIQTSTTPNVHALKFAPGKEVAGEATMDFSSIRYTDSSPLAR
jgi:hypothetical protein